MKESFSFFRAPITNVTPCREIGAEEVVKYLRSGFARERTESVRRAQGDERRRAKGETLDYVTFSGSFGSRQTGSLIHHSGLMCFDIDHITASAPTSALEMLAEGIGLSRLELMRERMAADPVMQPMIIFRSPSGDGLKVVVRVDMRRTDGADAARVNAEHRRIYDCISKYINRRYGVECDRTQDVARPCYLCHDAEAYYNEEARCDTDLVAETTMELRENNSRGKPRFYPWTETRMKPSCQNEYGQQRNTRPQTSNGTEADSCINNEERGETRIEKDDREKTEELVARLEQEGKNIAEEYDQWVRIGFALADGLGETGRGLFHRISALSQKYTPQGTDKKYDECLHARRGGVGIGTLFYYSKN